MATPRKHWFKVADSVAYEPWSNDVAATFIRLLGHLNTRWAREGRTTEQAVEVVLARGTAMQLTGCGSLARARSILNELATNVALMIDEQGTNTTVRWPKFAEFQCLKSDRGGESETDDPRAVPPPQDARRKTQDARQKTKKQRVRAEQSAAEPADPAAQESRPSEPERLAALLKAEIERYDPAKKVPRDLGAWAREFERMLRLDGRSARDIATTIYWLFGANQTHEARFVCFSAKSIREKFDRIAEARKRDGVNGDPIARRAWEEERARLEAEPAIMEPSADFLALFDEKTTRV